MSEQSVTKPAAKNYGPPKRRNCLMCLRRFLSRWPGERVCQGCRATKEWRGGTPTSHRVAL